MILRCQCCGFQQSFADSEAAFHAGWDAPPHFSGYICCNLCPATCIVLGHTHTFAHARWARDGRPETFGPDDRSDQTLHEDWDVQLKLGRELVETLRKMIQ